MENQNLRMSIEAILMATQEPVGSDDIARVCEVEEESVLNEIEELNQSYMESGNGFRISKMPSGYRYVTAEECYEIVAKFITEPINSKLSASAMETLAVIAYKQPVSRGQIASIRGVNVDSVIKTLESKDYIQEIGRDSGPGQAILYGTTESFLERLGINKIEDLPSLADFTPDPELMEQFEKSLLGETAS